MPAEEMENCTADQVEHALALITELKPRSGWCMENPATGALKHRPFMYPNWVRVSIRVVCLPSRHSRNRVLTPPGSQGTHCATTNYCEANKLPLTFQSLHPHGHDGDSRTSSPHVVLRVK